VRRSQERETSGVDHRPYLVLLVEDEPDSAELMSYILELDGFLVCTARSGDEGLRLVGESAFDLILLDVMLPGLDGFDVCRRLREDPRTSAIPVAFISARTRDEDRLAGMAAGADLYLAKPITRAALTSAVQWLLDLRGKRRTARPVSEHPSP
jgi:DNA-binding response OmpR family regulator